MICIEMHAVSAGRWCTLHSMPHRQVLGLTLTSAFPHPVQGLLIEPYGAPDAEAAAEALPEPMYDGKSLPCMQRTG